MQQTPDSSVHIDSSTESRVFNRFFQRCIGSCHAYLTLREDFRQQARTVQEDISFRYIRCHGIFHDWVGVCHPLDGKLHYNFQNVDKIYDFFLSVGLRPYVELSFMPQALASDLEKTVFRYEANISPPAEMARWNDLIRAFVTHLIERYGVDEVRHWYFEVWNEPDLKDLFWSGDQADYFELYRNTVTTIKAIDERLLVGGPSTSKNQWLEETLEFCHSNHLPLDFISTHHYCADAALEIGADVFELAYRGQQAMVDDVRRTAEIVRASAFAEAEIHYSEWNVSPCHEDRFGKDSEFNAAFVLQTLSDLDGLVDVYSYWCLSDIFEETGPGLYPFSGKYGLLNINGIKKPVFHSYHFLSQLYDEELPSGVRDCRVTRRDSDWRILLWQFVDPVETDFNGGDYQIPETEVERQIILAGLSGNYQIIGYRVDREAGNAYRAWQDMGSPQYPTAEQLGLLEQAAQARVFYDETLSAGGEIRLEPTLSSSAIVFYDIRRLA
jgi:xylan 1,4-beta-xylosidase